MWGHVPPAPVSYAYDLMCLVVFQEFFAIQQTNMMMQFRSICIMVIRSAVKDRETEQGVAGAQVKGRFK